MTKRNLEEEIASRNFIKKASLEAVFPCRVRESVLKNIQKENLEK